MNVQGYYSLIQYSEYPERNEFVNVGVVLFSEKAPRVLVRFSENARRVEKVFGVRLGQHYQFMKESLQNRIQSDFLRSWDRGSIEKFILLRSGKVRLSSPRSVSVGEPIEAIESLYRQLVGDFEIKKREPMVSSKLKRRFSNIGVEGLLERPAPIQLPQGVTIRAPFAYQNGSYNLIKAISLGQNPDQALEAAGKHAIEGKWLFDSSQLSDPKTLIVVGDTEGQDRRFTDAVSKVMHEHRVKFFSMEDLEPLAADIRKSATH